MLVKEHTGLFVLRDANMTDKTGKIRIVELSKTEANLRMLRSKYSTHEYYDVSVQHEPASWRIGLTRKTFEKELEKEYKGRLFEDHVEEPRVFVALLGNREVGWIELGYSKWNNRMRVWEFLVEDGFRRRGIGTLLMKKAVRIAKDKGARMLVLETQTNLVRAIDFYEALGFEFVGLDTAAYSNEDVDKKEVRLELGLRL
jgi:ribosomal protein S18 acetylase RimI-like enzyme